MDNKFISRNNINLIWDILSDNDQFAKLAENRIESIQTALKEDMELFLVELGRADIARPFSFV